MLGRALCIMSGGLDSTVSAYMAASLGYEIVALHFDYGQRTAERERASFHRICEVLKPAKATVLDLGCLGRLGGSALTNSNAPLPTSLSSKGEAPSTYVPFRNGIFLSLAGALAEVEACDFIYIGVVEEDANGYPDCSNAFISSMQASLNEGRATSLAVQIVAPLVNKTKAEIIKLGLAVGAPLGLTWSCYEGGAKACGLCSSCQLRLKGFEIAGLVDSIDYERRPSGDRI